MPTRRRVTEKKERVSDKHVGYYTKLLPNYMSLSIRLWKQRGCLFSSNIVSSASTTMSGAYKVLSNYSLNI